MKALVYTAPEKVVYRDFDEPRPKEGELLVKITNVGTVSYTHLTLPTIYSV